MSLKTLLMPMITQRRFSRERLLKKRMRAERARQSAGRPHVVHYFHQVDDPYSTLMTQALTRFQQHYTVEIQAHVVSPPPDSAAPERQKLVNHSRKDAAWLAKRHGLSFLDKGAQPPEERVSTATHFLVAALESKRFLELAESICGWLWSGDDSKTVPEACNELPRTSAEQVRVCIAQGDQLRETLGHYLGGMLYYEGEWYWAIDRLHHLEERLQDLGAQQAGTAGFLFPPDADLTNAVVHNAPPPIDFFFSFRSPYSAIVAPRVFELGRLTGAQVNLRFVLPMVMRGLPVPKEKREYIVYDTAREAHVRGIPFGRLNDPVGRPAERGLSLVPFAEEHGRGQAFVLSFMKGVWAEGIDAGSDKGLRRIVERAGLDWQQAQTALLSDQWRIRAEKNREALFGLGLWGVPSFRVGDTAVWGQDRLGIIQDLLINTADSE